MGARACGAAHLGLHAYPSRWHYQPSIRTHLPTTQRARYEARARAQMPRLAASATRVRRGGHTHWRPLRLPKCHEEGKIQCEGACA